MTDPSTGREFDGPTDWLVFPHPEDEDVVLKFHLNFMMSNWTCLFGKGCPGHFGKQDAHTKPDIGCCSEGFFSNSRADLDRIKARVERLTPEDVGPKGYAYIQKNGWLRMFKEGDPDAEDEREADEINAKSKVRDGGCVFAKRAGDGDEKTGCAFYFMGLREGTDDHTDSMPNVCWQAPIAVHEEEDIDGRLVREIRAWDAEYWGGEDEDGTHDSWMCWWCVDTPDAYVGDKMVYRSMSSELTKMIGKRAYDVLVSEIDKRLNNFVNPMPGAVRNEGRPMLPMLIGDRTPKRKPRE